MSEIEKHAFLAKGPYRQRRLKDLAKSLPIIGAILILIPLLWPDGDRASGAMIYIFAIWGAMIIVAGILSIAIREPKDEEAP